MDEMKWGSAGLLGKPFKPFLTYFWKPKTIFPNFCEKSFLAIFPVAFEIALKCLFRSLY